MSVSAKAATVKKQRIQFGDEARFCSIGIIAIAWSDLAQGGYLSTAVASSIYLTD